MDFWQCSEKVKQNIKYLIENGFYSDAQNVIEQYKALISNDLEIFSMEAIISILENRFKDAEKILIKGLEIDCNNFDLLYNLAYLYKQTGDFKKAAVLFQRAGKVATPEMKKKVDEMIEEIKRNFNIDEYSEQFTSIIILTHDNLEYTKLCIESIRKYTEKGTYEIIVVDNKSTDGTVEWLKKQNDLVLILNDSNLGFPRGCNQGIQLAKGDSILLLNNDVIVTPRWLSNLRKCLFSSEDIGAVGAATNNCSNLQAIDCNYKNLDEMLAFAENNNWSNSTKWEERLRLIGFCLLIKKEVINKVGLLDEIFTPGFFEDDDYCLRIRKAGYRLFFCKDAFIHHIGSGTFGKNKEQYNNLLIVNRKKFFDKWGIDAYKLAEIHRELTIKILNEQKQNPRVLHINCGSGGTLLDIKNLIPKAEVYGIENDKKLVVFNSPNLKNIKIGGLNKIVDFKKNYFDYILITNLSAKDFAEFGSNIINYLKEDGKIIIQCLYSEIDEYINNNNALIYQLNIESIENKQTIVLLVINKNKQKRIEKTIVTKTNEQKIFNVGSLLNHNSITYACQLIKNSKIKIENWINIAHAKFEKKEWEDTIKIIMRAADFAHHNHPGFFSSALMEALLVNIAQEVGRLNIDFDIKLPKTNDSKKRYLHVFSQCYSTGGHTRLADRMIKKLYNCDEYHSLVITLNSATTPQWLVETVKHGGGWYCELDKISPDFIIRALALRKLAREWADLVILHIHPHDPIPSIAFGIDNGPPVILINHADHAFWLNVNIADVISDIRPEGQVLSLKRRKALKSSLLPIPLDADMSVIDKKTAKINLGLEPDKLVILTIASAYKFSPVGNLNYFKAIAEITKMHDKIVVLVIGPQMIGAWKEISAATGGKVLPLGIRNDVKQYYAAADIYLDSFPLSSLTSTLDAGLNKLPVVALQNAFIPIFNSTDIALNAANIGTFDIETYLDCVYKLIHDKAAREDKGTQIHELVYREHCEEWSNYFASIIQLVQRKHRLNTNFIQDNDIDTNDIFLSYFQMISGLSNSSFLL